jgi:hypothetical protein
MRLALALLCTAMLAGCKIEADFSDNLPVKQLSAEAYQQDIVRVDQLVFRDAPLGDDGVQSLGATLESMAKRVGETDANSKFLKLESLELRLLAQRAKSLSPRSTARALQDNWMRIRNNLFDDRAWFARSAADLEYEAKAAGPQPKAVAAAPQPLQPALQPETEHRSTLTGRWQVVSVVANGKPRFDEDLSDSIWSFDSPRMTITKLSGHEKSYGFSTTGGYIELTGAEQGWMKYEMDSEGLRLAFYDGLKSKPESFESSGQNDPLLVVLRLVALR